MPGTSTLINCSVKARDLIQKTLTRALVGVPWIIVALTGCSFIYAERPTQCSVDSDCNELNADTDLVCDDGVCVDPTAATGATDPEEAWGCLQSGEKLVSTQPTVTQEIPLMDILTGQPPENIEGLVCQKFDQQCDSPSEQLMADEAGVLTFTVNAGFDGFLEVTADGIMPSRIQFFNVTDQGQTAVPPLIPLDAIGAIASASGVVYNPEKVTVLMELSDCTGKPLSNATGQTDARSDETAIRYLVNQVPSNTQEATTEDGLVALFNLEPGAITLRGFRQDGVNFASEGIVAPAGYIVYLGLRPNQ